MNKERLLQREIEDLNDKLHRCRMENRRLKWKIDRIKKDCSLFVKHTMKVFDMVGCDWRDVVELYHYVIEQEKHDQSIGNDS